MAAYYNEIDPYCCEWLRNLMAAGLIPTGHVDSRPIQEVQPSDLEGYIQCHFFAGLGGWPHAARLAGWPDDRPLWTGSCPCQPFSVAGRRKGVEDPRHLWPDFYRLIRVARPAVVMGEQTSAKAGYAWLDGVVADLEAEGYACQAVDIPAASVNAPHKRNRIYWVAYASSERRQQDARGAPSDEAAHGRAGREQCEPHGDYQSSGDGEVPIRLAHGLSPRLAQREGERGDAESECTPAERGGGRDSGLEHAPFDGRREGRATDEVRGRGNTAPGASGRTGGDGFWDSWEPIGPDPKGRYWRVKPGVRLLAHGVPCRVAKIRALGNAIVPALAAEVMKAWMECDPALPLFQEHR